MAREGDYAQDQYSRGYGHGVNGGLPSHDHPPPPPADEEEYEDDEDEDYDSQEDDEYEEEDDVCAWWLFGHRILGFTGSLTFCRTR